MRNVLNNTINCIKFVGYFAAATGALAAALTSIMGIMLGIPFLIFSYSKHKYDQYLINKHAAMNNVSIEEAKKEYELYIMKKNEATAKAYEEYVNSPQFMLDTYPVAPEHQEYNYIPSKQIYNAYDNV